MVTRTCAHCHKTYRATEKAKLIYCSMKCYNASRPKLKTTRCENCGKEVEYYEIKPRRFCSRSCATSSRNRTNQNPAYTRDVSGDKNPMYGRGLSGKKNPMYGKRGELAPRWKGGKKTRPDGYVRVIAPDGHPYPCEVKASGIAYVLEHRLVMERHIGRYLLPSEVVHHIDGNPSNNAIENLRLYSTHAEHVRTEHRGQKKRGR